ncbi:MAG: hypothetical protein CO109_03065 [Deltaproteobacteria bacterium CG_4_9_14_3_um_filter_65_9]|nr:MAG: hypothetical protein CO109_03065 [Deltaproteobacteria bacterium CG_4_9_14_3_um_filter_65_9]
MILDLEFSMSSALLSLLLKGAAAEALKREAASCKSRDLRGDPLTLLELLLLGFCSPLKGYLGRADCGAQGQV